MEPADRAGSKCGDRQTGDEPVVRTELHGLLLLPSMEDMLDTFLGDIDKAERRVMVETYIFADDKMGQMVADALATAAKRGVSVRLLFDPLGSQKTNLEFFEELRSRGVEVRAYRTPSPLWVGKQDFPRDHSRVMVVDDHAFTGGAAWADPWLPKERGGHGWHDVCLQVRGPCVDDFVALFDRRWKEAKGEPIEVIDFGTGDRYPDLELVADTPAKLNLVYDRHRAAIQRAKQRVWIENAYFFPPPDLLHDLYEAAERGVDVQLILPGETDLPIVTRAARSEYRDWIEHGLILHEYQQCVLHSKFALVDDDWCTVGTFNCNPTSVNFANEVNVFVFDPRFVSRVAKLFAADRELSLRIDEGFLSARGLVDQTIDQLAADALNVVDRLAGPSR
jgi:cardiolipin synthase